SSPLVGPLTRKVRPSKVRVCVPVVKKSSTFLRKAVRYSEWVDDGYHSSATSNWSARIGFSSGLPRAAPPQPSTTVPGAFTEAVRFTKGNIWLKLGRATARDAAKRAMSESVSWNFRFRLGRTSV